MKKFKELYTENVEDTTEINEMTPKEREAYYKETDKAMAKFVAGLAKLTKQTGISVETVGGLAYDDPKTISSVTYSNDFSSGDLSVQIKTK